MLTPAKKLINHYHYNEQQKIVYHILPRLNGLLSRAAFKSHPIGYYIDDHYEQFERTGLVTNDTSRAVLTTLWRAARDVN